MPTYEYACEACGHEFEREQRITEDSIKECPKCGKDTARRLIVAGNFILKGGGWESDLYSGPSNVKKDKAAEGTGSSCDSASSEGSGSKEGAKSESKSGEKEGSSSSSTKKAD